VAVKVNILIDQGASFETRVNVSDENDNNLNLVGYTASAKMKKHYLSANSIVFDTSISNGAIILSLTANNSALIEAGRYVYDCVLEAPNDAVIRLVEGIATVRPKV
jgi:hypothetical protein